MKIEVVLISYFNSHLKKIKYPDMISTLLPHMRVHTHTHIYLLVMSINNRKYTLINFL